MKKIMVLAAAAAILSLASCQKTEPVNNSSNLTSPIFTATINAPTKTTVNVSDGKLSWEQTDEITITDNSAVSAVYKIKSIDTTTGKAEFVIKDGEPALGDGPYTATYGTEPAMAQTYSATAGRLYMTAESSDNSFMFDVKCGLMKLALKKAGESVKSIAVIASTSAIYTLNCNPAESIASAKDFYIALPAGSYIRIEIANASGEIATLNAASGVTVADNHIRPVTIAESKIHFNPKDVLPGKFTVDDEGTQVNFSDGNLQAVYNGSEYTWRIASFQYDYIGNAVGNTTIGTTQTAGAVVDLFGWSATDCSSSAKWGISASTTNSSYGKSTNASTFKDWGIAYNEQEGITDQPWRTLSLEEWQYLIGEADPCRKDAESLYQYGVTITDAAGVEHDNCLIIAPDGYSKAIKTDYSAGEWVAAESEGLVCLPAAGYRSGTTYYSNSGSYWTADPYAWDVGYANYLYFTGTEVKINFRERSRGRSVRLVRDCE